MKYALNLASDGRVLSAAFAGFAPAEAVTVAALPEGDVSDYRFLDGAFLYEPLEKPENTPTWQDRVEAQLTYTAMMTDTLLEVQNV